MKINDTYKIFTGLIALSFASLLIATGCMDTNIPSNTNPYVLQANVYVADSANPANLAPLSGVNVHLYDLTQSSTNSIQNEITDNNGQVTFRQNVPLIGKRYRVEAVYGSITKIIDTNLCNNANVDFVFLKGGCANVCPHIIWYNKDEQFGTTMPLIDTLTDRIDNRVNISPSQANPNRVSYQYEIYNPDTSCSAITFNMSFKPMPGNSNYDYPAFYQIEPANLTLQPGQHGLITITFIAPIKDTLDAIVARRKTNSKLDSLFAVRLMIENSLNKCPQELDINAIVTAVPNISPIIDLRAYNQKTPEKLVPEHEVYYFGYASRTIDLNGEYPPQKGDIWIDVDNNDVTANPPQEPILKLIQTSGIIGMKIWKTNYAENDFYNVPQLVADFKADPNHSTGYSNAPLRGISVGDVIAFQLAPGIYTLIYIRRVDNGTEQTSSKQSGIEFRAITGIYIN
jgi:hypothetical protein